MDAELNEVLFEIHEFVLLDKGYFRLDHPELSQVTRRIGVLCAEGRSEGIDFTESHCTEFAFQLSADGEGCLFAEEVVGVVYLSVLVLFEIVEVLGCYLEHLSCTLAIGSGDERRVEIEVSVLMEIGVNGHCHVVTDTEYCAKRVGTRTQMGNRA